MHMIRDVICQYDCLIMINRVDIFSVLYHSFLHKTRYQYGMLKGDATCSQYDVVQWQPFLE